MRSFRRLRLLLEAIDLAESQAVIIRERGAEIAEWQKIALEANRATRDLAVAWRIAMEQPEVDLRDNIDDLIRDISDQVAKLEEQIVV